MSSIIGDAPCPRCREEGGDKTGNHLILFSNGNKYCNRCGYKENKSIKIKTQESLPDLEEITSIKPGGEIKDRKLQAAFVELFELRQAHSALTGEVDAYYMPVYETGTSKLLAYQKRTLPKSFSYIGSIRKKPVQFIGQHLARERGKFLIIVEGALDTIAAKQMLSMEKKSWTVVGAWSTSMKTQVMNNIEWLNGFDTIVFALDQDDAGKKALNDVLPLLPPNKCKVARYSENDPCDMLLADKAGEFVHSLTAAKRYIPRGVVDAKSVVKDYLKVRKVRGTPFPSMMEKLNERTDGVRPGELVVWTAGTGIGKSQFCDEVVADFVANTNEVCGVIKMEHNNAVSMAGILSVGIENNLKIHGDDYTDDELTEIWNKFFQDDKVFLIDHGFTGISDEQNFMSKLMGLVVGSGCTTIIIDHLHAVMNDTGSDNDDVDDLMYSLQRFAQLYGIKIHIVMHLRKTGSGTKSFETGVVPSLDDLKGSGALKQVPDTIIAVSRDLTEEDDELRRVSTLTVLKNRWLGNTGKCDQLIYDIDKAKYYPYVGELDRKVMEIGV